MATDLELDIARLRARQQPRGSNDWERASKRIRVTKPKAKHRRSRTPRPSDADLMATTAEQLWSGKTRGLFEFETIVPTNGLPMGAIGVAAGPEGRSAFFAYLKQPKVIARLEAEGFERAGWGAPHPWYLPLEPGVVSPCEKALLRAFTDGQRARTEANRIAALERGRQRVEKDVAALHGELSDDAIIAATDAAMAAHGAHLPLTRPCSICGYGDEK